MKIDRLISGAMALIGLERPLLGRPQARLGGRLHGRLINLKTRL
jgi:hypothetical protein